MTEDLRIFAPATSRNRDPIYQCLVTRLPDNGTLLEIASGSGEHAAHFAPLFPHLKWQPTNFDDSQIESVTAWRHHRYSQNLLEVLKLDATETLWPVEREEYPNHPITSLFNANMIHISPWNVCEGLMAGAGRILGAGGMLFLYGPFKLNGHHTSESNIQFEQWLKDQNPNFGVRDLDLVSEEASKNGLELVESCVMPANNFMQIFKKLVPA